MGKSISSDDKTKYVNDNDVEKLKSELSKIRNTEDLVQFLILHAATYRDFDSLYSFMEEKACPKDFTYNLVNGDSTTFHKVSPMFLYLINRNFRQDLSSDLRNIKTIEKIEKFDCWYDNLKHAYDKIKNDIHNNIKFRLDSTTIHSFQFPNHINGYINVPNNIKSWYRIFENSFPDTGSQQVLSFKHVQQSDKIDFELTNGITFLHVSKKTLWSDIIDKDSFLSDDLGGSLIASNISGYIHAQVFTDIFFIKINKRLVWIDVDR